MVFNLSLITYVNAVYLITLWTKNMPLAIAYYTAFHFAFWKSIWGIGILSDIEFDLYYTVMVFFYGLIGIFYSLKLKQPRFIDTKMLESSNGKRGGPNYQYRYFFGHFIILLIIGSHAVFEITDPGFMPWNGIILIAAILILWFLAYVYYMKTSNTEYRGKQRYPYLFDSPLDAAIFFLWGGIPIIINTVTTVILQNVVTTFITDLWYLYGSILSGILSMIIYFIAYLYLPNLPRKSSTKHNEIVI